MTMRLKIKTGIDLAPVVDIVFLLLTFFLLNVNIQRTHEIAVDLPASEADQEKERQENELILGLSAAGTIFMSSRQISRTELEGHLRHLKAPHEMKCRLSADKSVPYASVVDLLGLLQKHKILRVELLARSK